MTAMIHPVLPTRFEELRTADLRDLRTIASNALQSAQGMPFQQHPLGFLFRTLQDTGDRRVRLHVWPPGAQTSNLGYDIHDHAFSFVSRTLAGVVRHSSFNVHPQQAATEHVLYEVLYEGQISTLRKTDRFVLVSDDSSQIISPGESYELSHVAFHSTQALGTAGAATLTVMERTSSACPLVVGPSDGPESLEFARVAPDLQLVKSAGAILFPPET